MLTSTAYPIIPKKIGKRILKRQQIVLLSQLFLTEGACHAKNKLEVLFIDASRNIYMIFFVLSDSNKLYSNNHL